MAQTSKNVLAALLIVTIIISVFGTWTALSSLVPYQGVPQAEDISTASARVSVDYMVTPNLPPEPDYSDAEVNVNLVDETQGG